MLYLKITLIAFLLLNSCPAIAGYRGIIEKSGYFGELALGVGIDWNSKHTTDFSLGSYQIDRHSYYQINFSYRYSPWGVLIWNNSWMPLQGGVFAVYAIDQNRYFLNSPERYPKPDYYDQTAFRYGLELSSTYVFLDNKISLSYRIRFLDTSVIAAYNNSETGLFYNNSWGLGFSYFF